MVNSKYNMLTIIEDLGMINPKEGVSRKHCVKVICDCGVVKIVALGEIKNGNTRSCGCFARLNTSIRSKKHSLIKENLYRVWGSMKKRVKKGSQDEERYYKRGITICTEWENSYVLFRTWALLNGYKIGLQLDRINNNLGYSPDNCRFVTARENSLNRENTTLITFNNITKPLSIWADETGIKRETIRRRIDKYKWSIEDALTKKARPFKNI